MNRLLVFIALALTACQQIPELPEPERFAPETVLERATVANEALQSARFVVQGDFALSGAQKWSSEGDARIEGRLTHGGDQMQFQLDTNVQMNEPNNAYMVDATIEMIFTLEDAIYLHLHALSIEPSGNLFRPDLIGQFANRWWLLPPSNIPQAGPADVAPDPKFLQSQAQVVAVKEDLGIEMINGREAYRYRVAIDNEKLLDYMEASAEQAGEEFSRRDMADQLESLEAEGELWIDAGEFWVHRITWDILFPFEESVGTFSFTATLRDHNQDLDITLPNDVQEFSPLFFLGAPLNIDSPPAVDPVLPTSSADVQKGIIDQIIEDMSLE